MLIDWTDLGDEEAGTEEVLHYVHDALGSVVGLTDAGDPDATPEPVPPKLVERYDYDPYGKTYIESWDATGGGGSNPPGVGHTGWFVPRRYVRFGIFSPKKCITCCKSFQASVLAGGLRSRYAG